MHDRSPKSPCSIFLLKVGAENVTRKIRGFFIEMTIALAVIQTLTEFNTPSMTDRVSESFSTSSPLGTRRICQDSGTDGEPDQMNPRHGKYNLLIHFMKVYKMTVMFRDTTAYSFSAL